MQAFSCRKEAKKEIQRVVIVRYNHRSFSPVWESRERGHSENRGLAKRKTKGIVKT